MTQEQLLNTLQRAWQHFHQKDLAGAQALAQEVLAAAPDHAEAMNLLGIMEFQGGKVDEAIGWLSGAARAEPGNPIFRNNLGVMNERAQRRSEAKSCFEEALRLQPNYADAHSNLSNTYYHLGLHEQARASATEALRLKPDFAEARNHLGLALLELGRVAEAERQFREALRLKSGLMEANLNLGMALQALGRSGEAAVCYRQILRVQPHLAEAHNHLGVVLKEEGDFAAAVQHLRQAVRIKPDYALAWWNLCHLIAQGHGRIESADVERLDALSRNERLSVVDRSLVHRALADLLDRMQSHDTAFNHYRQANALRKQDLQQAGADFNQAAFRTMVDGIIAAFDADFFRQVRSTGSLSEVPVFVVGMPRSGTTLVEQILSSHSQVVGAGELFDLTQLLASLDQAKKGQGGYPACLSGGGTALLQDVADRYLDRLAKLGGPAARVVDKMPGNFLHLGAIALMFPRARIIHCRRDPLDCCLSCFLQNFKRISFAFSLEDLGMYYREYERVMAHWRRVLPMRMIDVRYEDLVSRQEAVSRELISYCGLEWEDRCLAFHKNPRTVAGANSAQVRRPMYVSSVGRSRRYSAHLEPLYKALGIASPNALTTPGEGISSLPIANPPV
jgi:tetratricopeptide (TPR) repeat protein